MTGRSEESIDRMCSWHPGEINKGRLAGTEAESENFSRCPFESNRKAKIVGGLNYLIE